MDKKTNRLTPENFWVNDEKDIQQEEAEAEELFGATPTNEDSDEGGPGSEKTPDEVNEAAMEGETVIVPSTPVLPSDEEDPDEAEDESDPDDDEEEDDEPEDEIKKLIQLVTIIGSAILALVLVIALVVYLVNLRKTTPTAEDSSAWTESLSYESGEVWGVIVSVEDSVVTIYDADSQQTQAFDLSQAKNITDQYGQSMSIDLIKIGQIVQVQYNSANNQVEMFRLTSKATEISNATGVIVQDHQVIINDQTYEYDDQLICLYEGQAYPIENVSAAMIVNAGAIENHLYTLQILSGSVWLEVQNIPKDYVGAELILTPDKGEEVVQLLSEETHTVEIPEGVFTYRVRKDNKTLEQGQFVAIGNQSSQILALNTTGAQEGTVVFDCNVTEGVSLTIDDLPYDITEEIILSYGDYTALIQAEGSEPMEVDIHITQPYQVIKVDINATTTKVTVSSSLSGTKLLINGEYQATLRGQAESFDLEAGTYVFLAQNDGYEDMTITVTVKANMADQVIYFTGFQPEQPTVEDSQEQSTEDSQESTAEE